MTKDEALKLALETAEGIVKSDWRKWQELASPDEFERWVKSRALHMATAIKEALAQPEQEPVAWLEPEWGEKICPEIGYEVTITDDHPRDLCWIPLVPVTPPQRTWVGLTDEETDHLFNMYERSSFGLVRAVEAKLKEKNT